MIALSAISAFGQAAITPVTAGGVTVSLPRSWKTTSDPGHSVFTAQRDPNHKDAPAMLVVIQPSSANATEDQLLTGT